MKFHKVLVLAMSQKTDLREQVENKLTKTLQENGISANGSLAFFGKEMETLPKTMDDWLPYIQQLKQENFDSVLITKIVGQEGKDAKNAIVRYYNEFFGSFKEDIMKNKDLYSEDEGFKDYYVHRVASNLYCICEQNQEEDLIWKLNVDIKQAFDSDYLVKEGLRLFSKELIKELKEQDLFVTNK
ncbi:hypothetical protein [Mesonia maritima]|uniref:Uncharacterized protein n=2 Tax=Mesonia maritima TaxID=1793873 RepID=A0ABU1K7I8_9FLAO|nr:hypothetical protein [Mesonia maritima]MDR6301578.1 hypothetical protein [Mesonia maritima]